MLIDEIVRTCSHEKVAQAAVASLGFAFASRVKKAADEHGLSVGAFAARAVREFAGEAHAVERRVVGRAMHKADQPILRGLQIILEREIEEPESAIRWRDAARHAAPECGCSP
ncbi:MAG TPA: hypothetical protein VKV77_08710 [Methylovirgula sp.]|nr:hypothetical protein [Methylovirgula sp.]